MELDEKIIDKRTAIYLGHHGIFLPASFAEVTLTQVRIYIKPRCCFIIPLSKFSIPFSKIFKVELKARQKFRLFEPVISLFIGRRLLNKLVIHYSQNGTAGKLYLQSIGCKRWKKIIDGYINSLNDS